MPTPMPPPPLPDPDDDIPANVDPGMSTGRGERRRRSGSSTSGASEGTRTYPSFFAQLNRRAWVVIGILAAVIIGATVALVSRGNDSAPPTLIETDRAVATLQSLLKGVDSSKELATCPFGSVSDVVRDLNDEFKFAGPVTDDVHRIVIDGKDSVGEVLCSAGTADDRVHVIRTLYVYATPVPKGSYPDYLTKTRLVDAVVKVEGGSRFNGGTIYAYCISGPTDIKPGCGADWVADDSRLVLGLQVTGEEVSAKSVSAALTRELPTLAERLGARSATSVPGTAAVTSPTEPPGSSTPGTGAGTDVGTVPGAGTSTLATTPPTVG